MKQPSPGTANPLLKHGGGERCGDSKNCGALKEEWPIDDLDDCPFDDPSIDGAALYKSLLQSEADRAAGRTFCEEDIRARYGLPRSDAD